MWRKSRTKCSFWRCKLSRWEVIFAFCVAGARLWKLLAWKVAWVSHEMLVLALQTFKVRGHFRVLRGRRKTLEAPCLKSCRSLARNARFGTLFFEKLRKPRTKCSFWKLVAWKVEEASHEMLVLEASCSVLDACSLKSWGSLARNARFGSKL